MANCYPQDYISGMSSHQKHAIGQLLIMCALQTTFGKRQSTEAQQIQHNIYLLLVNDDDTYPTAESLWACEGWKAITECRCTGS